MPADPFADNPQAAPMNPRAVAAQRALQSQQASASDNAEADGVMGDITGVIGGIIGAYLGGPAGAVAGFGAGQGVGKGISQLATDRPDQAGQSAMGALPGVAGVMSAYKKKVPGETEATGNDAEAAPDTSNIS